MWMRRLHDYYKDGVISTSHSALGDSIDILCAHVMHKPTRLHLAEQIAALINCPSTSAEAYLTTDAPHLPTKSINGAICMGRAEMWSVSAAERRRGMTRAQRLDYLSRQAMTRATRTLLQSVAACVRLGEPVLLVGETGTGKTASVQTLAAILGEWRLHAHVYKRLFRAACARSEHVAAV
jgi:midasin